MATFDPPGPGRWAVDRSHFSGGATPISQWLVSSTMGPGLKRAFAELGVPATALEARFVNGFQYTRLTPLIAPDRAMTRLPPTPLLRLMTRLHPAFRARAATAQANEADRPFLAVVERWERELKPDLVAANRAFQDVEVTGLDDEALARHLGELLDHLRRSAELHFWLHGYDLGPVADFAWHCDQWGIPPAESVAALAGASPATSAPAVRLHALRQLIEQSGRVPASLDEVRSVSAEAAALLDEHLAEKGHLLVSRYDLDGLTLHEMPGAVLGAILAATPPPASDHEVIAAQLRERVPPQQRATFDDLLASARAVMDVRDDNGPNTYEWPAGILRRGLLEVGRRAEHAGRLSEVDHVLELEVHEVRDFTTARGGPTGAELARRASARAANARLDPPPVLGPAEPAPPVDVLPPPLAHLVSIIQFAIDQLGMSGATTADPLAGVGIGTSSHRGRARTAASPEEAIDAVQPGDVLVVRATSPAFNVVLSIAGAVVTSDGGPLSHAAVLARELGIPAVVGAPGALDIPDGAEVEVDPIAGCVRIIGVGSDNVTADATGSA